MTPVSSSTLPSTPAAGAPVWRSVQIDWAVSASAARAVVRGPEADGMSALDDARLLLEAQVDAGDRWCAQARLVFPDGASVPLRASPADARVRVSDGLVLLDLDADGDRLLTAAFRDGVLVYARSRVPSDAGLPGGTYDGPSGHLSADPL